MHMQHDLRLPSATNTGAFHRAPWRVLNINIELQSAPSPFIRTPAVDVAALFIFFPAGEEIKLHKAWNM